MCAFYSFHVNLFAAPPGDSYAATWEQAAAELERLPRMILEPDGSFVISGDADRGQRWQVDGHLFDFAGRLHRVELHGECPPADFDHLLRCIGWPVQRLVFVTVREGQQVDEEEFRRMATADDRPARKQIGAGDGPAR